MTDEQGTTTKIKYDANGETTDIDGQKRWRYVIGIDKKDPERGELAVNLTQPDESQLLVLLRLVDLAEDDAVATVRLFADALDALMAPGESHRCQRWLLQGRIDAEAFMHIGEQVVYHYWPEVEEDRKAAPKHGPTARPRRR